MPMHWTDTSDAHLFAHLLRTHKFKIDIDALTEAMRNEEQLSPGAIDRRIKNLRSGRAGPALGNPKKSDATSPITRSHTVNDDPPSTNSDVTSPTPNQKRKRASGHETDTETNERPKPKYNKKQRRFSHPGNPTKPPNMPHTRVANLSNRPSSAKDGMEERHVRFTDKEGNENRDRMRDWLDLIYPFLAKISRDPVFREDIEKR
ncbi:hypothetical protein L228DRAFT_284526 [Xylona heveae TC161]|uniref:Uncharacterized protein n=1 Tax=Xylona heveae (strain CBS 132557 / TC161) TaxID=1328760 RepID=A0A165AJ45_XYLHT|nr:hypothetical protein L228DRAFT_284526 [Xylona heveae TC161]KZF20563.1 hypothetical protein L228DRAFT_284526 [Xylona heveae TC161]